MYCFICRKPVKFKPITPQVMVHSFVVFCVVFSLFFFSKPMINVFFFFLLFKDLPASVRSSFESTERLPEQFESVAEFQEEIQNNFTDELVCI